MRVEYINPFVESAYNVLREVLGVSVSRGRLNLQDSDYTNKGVAAIVRFSGDVAGNVLLGMSEPTAVQVASLMLQNMNMDPVSDLDDLAKATITELANMVTGQSITRLNRLGFQFELTPPRLLIGSGDAISLSEEASLLITLKLEFGDVELFLSVKEI